MEKTLAEMAMHRVESGPSIHLDERVGLAETHA